MNTAISEFTGQPVDTWSEAWRHECECSWILSLPSREARNKFLYGSVGFDGKKVRGVADVRGKEAADLLRSDAEKLYYMRKEKAAQAAASPQLSLV